MGLIDKMKDFASSTVKPYRNFPDGLYSSDELKLSPISKLLYGIKDDGKIAYVFEIAKGKAVCLHHSDCMSVEQIKHCINDHPPI